jgi:hypothetical protein
VHRLQLDVQQGAVLVAEQLADQEVFFTVLRVDCRSFRQQQFARV